MRRECIRRTSQWTVKVLCRHIYKNGTASSVSQRLGSYHCSRSLHASQWNRQGTIVPLRKELKDSARAAKASNSKSKLVDSDQKLQDWELTVGIEIHAQLNTTRKLFSAASSRYSDKPNTELAHFDLSLPGSQPRFQYETLIPALRAAIALGCSIQKVSKFDRKHYFYHDQPAGYQITQYYHPFAKDGSVRLGSNDDLNLGEDVLVGIKQIQMEQDTARTQEQDQETNLIDFNRAGYALIEIISLPQIHSPKVASAYLRKVQSLLSSVDAVTTGMEMGGLRADVNVSVRRKSGPLGAFSYSGVKGLGQRTEIKNLSTLRGVEDAIKAERDRQIGILEAGEVVEGETRGWSVTEPSITRRLRGKEGEVDYRYMPDPDIPPLHICSDIVQHLSETMPPSPERLQHVLMEDYGLSNADAKSLLFLDDGQRFYYFQDVVDQLQNLDGGNSKPRTTQDVGRYAGNWVLHELGSLMSSDGRQWNPESVPAQALARIIHLRTENQITGTSAKEICQMVYKGDNASVDEIVDRDGLLLKPVDEEEYVRIAEMVLKNHPDHVRDIRQRGKQGKIMFLVGKMMREGKRGQLQASKAEQVLRRLLILAK